MVEAQHRLSTLKLVDSVDEHEILEARIEASKPPVPPECQHLHFLLWTPFRYGAAYPRGSRFRRAGMTAGVFYASEIPETAAAEMAFYRLLFFAESPDTPWPANPQEHTAFATQYRTNKAIDLTETTSERARWTHPTDYSHCQDFADAARAANVEIIRYISARDPSGDANLAVLTCRAFAKPEPTGFQTWHLRLSEAGVQAVREFPRASLNFDRQSFAADPRIAKLKWVRI
jgi:hypothetical protein